MLRYLQIEGAEIGGNARKIFPSEMDKAIGGVAGWNMLFDPAYVDIQAEWTLNRVTGSLMESRNVNEGDGSLQQIGGNTIMYLPTDGTGSFYQFFNDAAINREAWTFWFVILPDSEDDNKDIRQYLALSEDLSEVVTPGLSIALIKETGQLIVYDTAYRDGGQPIRLEYPDGNYDDRTDVSLAMVTFSTEGGLKIFDNGNLVASAPNDTRPLESGFDVGGMRYLRTAQGKFGMMGQHNVDLGLERHTGDRYALEQYLFGRYGITR